MRTLLLNEKATLLKRIEGQLGDLKATSIGLKEKIGELDKELKQLDKRIFTLEKMKQTVNLTDDPRVIKALDVVL